MSKTLRAFSLVIIASTFFPIHLVWAQKADATLELDTSRSVVTIDKTTRPGRNLSFLTSIAGVSGIAGRITNIELRNGPLVPFRKLIDGEYLAETDFNSARYAVDLTPLKNRQAAAHVSWMRGDVGILMLGDLLPLTPDRETGRVRVGSAWPIYTADAKSSDGTFAYKDQGDAIFYVGPGWRSSGLFRCKETPVLSIAGEWHFTDDEAAKFAADIFEYYDRLFPTEPDPNVQIAIARFPVPTESGAWEAETRGRSVTIISSDMPFRAQSLQRLHEQLRHELFHLWIPNNVNLTGNYDWFYEGFALYQSLKLAIAKNQIRFDDFLDTLSRAHTIDSAYTQRPSLIEASKTRFGGTNTQVYARGMLVAFLVDVVLMSKSRGTVEDILRKLYARHQDPAVRVDGNKAVMDLFRESNETSSIVKKYIVGSETIDWKNELAAAGIEDKDPGTITTLRVRDNLSGRQKTLLDKLGYNNWRRLSPDSK